MLRVIFWVVLRCVVFNSRHFRPLCLFHLHRRVDMTSETSAIKHHAPGNNPKYYTQNIGILTSYVLHRLTMQTANFTKFQRQILVWWYSTTDYQRNLSVVTEQIIVCMHNKWDVTLYVQYIFMCLPELLDCWFCWIILPASTVSYKSKFFIFLK
jgi:hypothetical protein